MWFEGSSVRMIDQRLLPHEFRIFEALDVEDIAYAIEDMIIRGAPSIGAAAAFGLALAKINGRDLSEAAQLLKKTRPTARDLFYAIGVVGERIEKGEDAVAAARSYADDVVARCQAIGKHGARLVKPGARILTHCSTGGLATVDYGTAFACIRLAQEKGRNVFVYISETRPRLQGARLTAWECKQEGVEHVVIADSAAGWLMNQGMVDAVMVGADRIAKNGDVANKIGTYTKAVIAKENGIPFYVAAPTSTFDHDLATGRDLPIEERSAEEVLNIGSVRIAPEGSRALNPAFDVTPAKYVTAFVTEKGVIKPKDIRTLR